MKKILSILMAVVMVFSALSLSALADDAKAKIYISEKSFGQVQKDDTKLVVPICVDGSIDMQCYDITVTYDKSLVSIVADETYIVLPSGEYSYGVVNTGTSGEIRFAGMTVEESAKSATGEIGQLVFTSSKRVNKDGISVKLGLSVAELGFGTEVSDIDVVAESAITLNKSAVEETPAPSKILIGDVNMDEIIDAKDALDILKHAAKLAILEGDALTAADADKDGNITSADALAVLKHAAGIEKLVQE